MSARIQVGWVMLFVTLLAACRADSSEVAWMNSRSTDSSTETTAISLDIAAFENAPACSTVLVPGQILPDDLWICKSDAGEFTAIVALGYACENGDTFAVVNAGGAEREIVLAFLESNGLLHEFPAWADGVDFDERLEAQEKACVEWAD